MKTYYNLWGDFAVKPWPDNEPVTKVAQSALDAFLSHARNNVCNGDEAQYRWLIGFFGHLIQKPEEKPLVAIVLKGPKGSGKNSLIETVGYLLGNHFLVTSNRRYLVGSFNGHLERLLFFCLDEAFWSGDKQAEGILKDMITGKEHVIEHKGKEPYTVNNLCRVAILGNEDWIVPASHDERRFFVLEVGDGRKQDNDFFQTMREGMEMGGYRLLLRFLKTYPLAGFNPNKPPRTGALLDQKHSSLPVEHEWWLESLGVGRLVCSDFGEGWPTRLSTERFRSALARYAKERNVRSRIPNEKALGKAIRKVLPQIDHKKNSGNAGYDYVLPPLADCRAAWDKFIGHEEEWSVI